MEHIEFDDNLFDEGLAGSKVNAEEIQKAISSILQAVGENPEREGLKRTPERVARMYAELLVWIYTLTRLRLLTMPSLMSNMTRW